MNSKLFRSLSGTLFLLAVVHIPIMLFLDRVSGNYWKDIWLEHSDMENRARTILVLMFLAFVSLVIAEFIECKKEK